MNIIFITLIVLAGLLLGFFILVQNPKGSGLSSSIVGGFDNNFFGVKRTTDILEKGTWFFAIIIGLLCLFSSMIINKNIGNDSEDSILEKINTKSSTSQPFIPNKKQ